MLHVPWQDLGEIWTTRFVSVLCFFWYPIGSMYGIYANIWGILMVNVTIYSIHGSYGYWAAPHSSRGISQVLWVWNRSTSPLGSNMAMRWMVSTDAQWYDIALCWTIWQFLMKQWDKPSIVENCPIVIVLMVWLDQLFEHGDVVSLFRTIKHTQEIVKNGHTKSIQIILPLVSKSTYNTVIWEIMSPGQWSVNFIIIGI